MQDRYEERIKQNIQQGASHQNPHGLGWIARSADEACQIIGYRGEEHTRHDDNHIFARVGDSISRSAKEHKDTVHEDVGARDEQDAEENSKPHAVAQNLLRPTDIPATQYDGHSGTRSGTN